MLRKENALSVRKSSFLMQWSCTVLYQAYRNGDPVQKREGGSGPATRATETGKAESLWQFLFILLFIRGPVLFILIRPLLSFQILLATYFRMRGEMCYLMNRVKQAPTFLLALLKSKQH